MPRFPMWWTTQAWIRQQRREPQARALRFSLKMRRKKSKSRIAGLFGSLLMCLVSSGVRKHALHFHQPFVEVFHVPSPFQWISCFSKWQGALGGRLLLWFSIQRSDFASWPRWFWHVLTSWVENHQKSSCRNSKKWFKKLCQSTKKSVFSMVFPFFPWERP